MSGILTSMIFLLTLLSPGLAFAYDLSKPEEIEFAEYDHPNQFAEWLKKELPHIDREKRFPEWIRGLVAYISCGDFLVYPGDPNDLVFGEGEAKARGYYREYLHLKHFRLRQQLGGENSGIEDVKKMFNELISEAKHYNQKGFEYRLTAELAWIMVDSGNAKEGVGKIMEIPKTRPLQSKIGVYVWIEILQYVVASVRNKSNWDRQLTVYREILKELDVTRPRYMLSNIKFNLAMMMIRNNVKLPDLDPEQLLHDSIQMAMTINSKIIIASATNALGVLYYKQGRFQESLEQLSQALAYFDTSDDPLWQADTQKKLAATHLAMRHYKEASSFVEKARKTFKPDYKNDHIDLLALQHQILAAQQSYKDAYPILKEELKFYRENLAANEQLEISSRLIGIEIELEQSRSQALEMEAAAKQRKALIEEQLQEVTEQHHKTLDLFIRGVLVLLALIAVLFVWAQTLHRKTEAVNLNIRENLLLRFVPPALAHAIATGERRMDQEAQRFHITVVFARIVHFEDLIEKLGPNYLAEALSPFLESMSEVIFAHGGTIDKFNRGTLMLIFGAPVMMNDESQVHAATRCAEAMLLRLDDLQQSWALPHGLRLQLAIGIHHGPALVGFFGGEQRTDYTAIGATVNMASRIEGLAAPGDIVVSEITALKLKDEEYRLMGHFMLKGIEDHQALYIWVRAGEQEAVS